jgi:leucyl-tRNA synthetase
MGEELWNLYGHTESIAYEKWPTANPEYIQEDTFEYPVSFNGKMRFKLELPIDMPNHEIEQEVLNNPKSQKWTESKTIRKIVIVSKKIINVVVS